MKKSFFSEMLRDMVKGWKPLEIVWLTAATAAILILSLVMRDTPMGIIAALTGTWCVILTGKGKVSNFLFGIVNVVLYAIISWQTKYYGEVMLNLLYYLPCSVLGLFVWSRHTSDSTGDVAKEQLSVKASLIIYPLTAAAVVAYGFILKALGGQMPFTDSISTVLSVVAQILCLKRLTEQWVMWIVVDAVSVVLWAVPVFTTGESVAMLLMWIVYLINAVIMYINWRRDTAAAKEKVVEA